jgi:hypothetical protein
MFNDSYKSAPCCGDECIYLGDNPDQPCWGQVMVVDEAGSVENHWWVHACEGHADLYNEDGEYVKEVANGN